MSAQDPVVRELAATLDDHARGAVSSDELQARLQSALSLLERRPESAQLARALRTAEADLEEIRFLVPAQEQPTAVARVRESLRPAIAGPSTHCRVCGYDWGEPVWGPTGTTPSFDICPCCQVEAGYEDSSPESARAYRAEWLAAGAPWSARDEPHDGLSTQDRLRQVPSGFE